MMFDQVTFTFLEQLSENNNKAWFEEHKDRYTDKVLFPALEFIEAMAPRLQIFAPHFTAIPKRVGGSLMRIYRDTRFSKDKTPFKTNIGIQFRHALGKDIHAPGFYVHIAVDECFVGVGCWHPDADTLGKIRDRIAEYPDAWFQVSNTDTNAHWSLWGDKGVRPPYGYSKDHPAIEDLKRKDFILLAPLTRAEVMAANFPDLVEQRFAQTTPFIHFLCDAVGVQY
jgi:uncharacterized protein (TIGR02453 family)